MIGRLVTVVAVLGWAAVVGVAIEGAARRLVTRWRARRQPATTVPEPASALGPVFDPRAELFDWAARCPHLTNTKETTAP